MRISTALSVAAGLGTLFVLLVPRWHHPVDGTELGPNGTSMVQFASDEKMVARMNAAPASNDFGVDQAAVSDMRPSSAVFKNLQVVTGTSAGEFAKLHVAMTNWVAPKEGCGFCHQGTDWSSEAKPQFHAARVMLQMVRALNTDWKEHVGQDGVTCYTCHRGQNIPAVVWFPKQSGPQRTFIAEQESWHEAATTVRDFFPDAGFSEYLLQDTAGHGQAYTALSGGGGPPSQREVKRLYEVMMQMSDGIGVNCGYCHNSRAFFDWGESTPHRLQMYDGIHMTQAINRDVLLPLAATMPQTRQYADRRRLPIIPASESGAQDGNALAVCATCHYGAPKPLNGQSGAANYPWLVGGTR